MTGIPALFEPTADGFVAHPYTRGPWDERMMHGGAPSALIARAIERALPADGLEVARLTIDFLGGVPIGPVAVQADVLKPGRRFALIDATLDAAGRRSCLARAVCLRAADLPGARASPPDAPGPLPPPDAGSEHPGFVDRDDGVFYPDACEIRSVGGEFGSGALAAWVRLRGEVVPGEQPSPLQRVAAAADFANGLGTILEFADWIFVNTDLSIQLWRRPESEWIGVDARTSVGPTGVGLSSAVLHDVRGPVGTCAQTLFVERR
jgi:acyl-coenzyme A thioesterase PaaI-like protein